MPATRSSSGAPELQELIDALLDPKVVEALGQALGANINRIVQAGLVSLVERVTELERGGEKAAEERQTLTEENEALRKRIDDMEAYSRCENLVIHGIPPSSFSDAVSSRPADQSLRGSSSTAIDQSPTESNAGTEAAVLALANSTLGLNLTREDISVAHRLPKRPLDTKPAPILVWFSNRRARNAMYQARKQLKSLRSDVYINEHLIKSRAVVLSEARKLVKSQKLEGAWTSNGVVFIRISGLPNSRPIKADSLKDLPTG